MQCGVGEKIAYNGTALCRQDFKARLFGKLDTVD